MVKDLMKLVSAKKFNYKKALEAYYANQKSKVKIFPKNPSDNDVHRLKLELQNLIASKKNPVYTMDYYAQKDLIKEKELKSPSLKKEDVFQTVKDYYDEQGY